MALIKNIPDIRFKGFANKWDAKKLGKESEIIAGGTPSTAINSYWEPKEIPWMSSGEVNKKRLFGTDNMISKEGYNNSSARWIKKDSVLIALAGQGKTRGTVAINAIPLTTNQSIAAIIPNENINHEFLFQNLSKRYEELRTKSSGDGSRGGLNKQIISEIELITPNIIEQSQIGNYFQNLDNLITLHQKKYNKMIILKKAMLEKMFPKAGADIPEIRFEGFEGAWEEKQLEDVIDVRSGRDYKHLSKGNIPVYGTGGYMLSVNDALSVNENAIGIGRKGTIDKPYILTAPFWTVDTLFYAIPRVDNDLNFIHCIFQKVDWKQKDESTGVPSLSKVAINFTKVSLPCYSEQLAIGEYFEKIDKLLSLHQKELAKLKNIKIACLEKMFV